MTLVDFEQLLKEGQEMREQYAAEREERRKDRERLVREDIRELGRKQTRIMCQRIDQVVGSSNMMKAFEAVTRTTAN